MGRLLLFIALMSLVFRTTAQEDNVGSGRALSLNGSVGHVDLGDRYDDIQLPVTVSAWIYLSSSVSNWAPVFVSQDNANLYNGFWLIVQPGLVGIGYGDGTGENLPLYRRSKTALVNDISERWVHVTGVIRDKLDMDIYVNGVNVGGNYSGTSNLPMSASDVDVARMGRWRSNGMTFYFKGMIDEVRVWNRSLSQSEVRGLLCRKVQGTEDELVGNWTFNETSGTTIRDKSTNGFDGMLIGGQHTWSGAPIGDDSEYLYRSVWDQATVSAVIDGDSLTVANITGDPYGVHVYRVLEAPSQDSGLPDDCMSRSYFGVFTDSHETGIGYNLHYNLTSSSASALSLYTRADNGVATWNPETDDDAAMDSFVSEAQLYRGEYLRVSLPKVDLGENKSVCDQAGILLDLGPVGDGATVLWSTGTTTPTLVVTESGTYAVTVQNACGTAEDEIQIEFGTSPPLFNVNSEHENLCTTGEIILSPSEDLSEYNISWNDGSGLPILVVTEPGTYALKASNLCGEHTSSVTIGYTPVDSVFIPNVITPGGDDLNQKFQIKDVKGPLRLTIYNRLGGIVYRSTNYQNDWDGERLPSGIYYYQVSGGCMGERKGALSILRH